MNNKIRILIVDDDPDWKADFAKNVSDWGYEAYIAKGAGYELIEDAKQKVVAHCCHIALVDKDLFDQQGRNKSGWELINDLQPAKSIGVTAYSPRESMKEAFLETAVSNFVGKDEGPDALKQAIQNLISEEWPFVLGAAPFKINWPGKINAKNLTERFQLKTDICLDEIEALLYKHFDDVEKVKIELQDGSSPTNGISFAFRGRSAVFKATLTKKKNGLRQRPILIKIARRNRIKKEEDNYKEFVQSLISFRHKPHLRKCTLLWHIGVVEYDFASAIENNDFSLQTFADYYQTASPENIEKTLVRLFDIGFPSSPKQDTVERTVLQAYDATWNSTPTNPGERFIAKLMSFEDQSELISFSVNGRKFKLPNPVNWIVKRVDLNGKDLSPSTDSTRLAITHGDMHGENILIVGDGEPILIDFERTGYGLISQDFVLLEGDILLKMSDLSIENSLALFVSILSSIKISLNNNLLTNKRGEGEKLQKTWHSIKVLREIAEKKAADDFRIYFWGLLLNIGFRCVFLETQIKLAKTNALKSLKADKLKRTQLYGGLICLKLENPNRVWPPTRISELL